MQYYYPMNCHDFFLTQASLHSLLQVIAFKHDSSQRCLYRTRDVFSSHFHQGTCNELSLRFKPIINYS